MPSPTSANKVGNTKVVLNIEEPKCRFPYFLPAGRALRSTVRADRLKHQSGSPVIMAVGEIPGEQIVYDGEKGVARIRDRYGDKANAELRAEVQRLVARSPSILDQSAAGAPLEEESYKLHTDDDRATWLAHMRRLVDSGAAEVVEGTLPSAEDINRLGTWTKGEYFGFTSPHITKHPKVVDA